MRGFIDLPLWRGKAFRVFGGRYVDKPDNYLGVKMAVEIGLPCDVDVPVRDFSIPTDDEFSFGVRDTIKLLLNGKPVYVGCMGGIGRTGLMLAGLAKSFGIEDPVVYVRENYYSHAVETKGQMAFIEAWQVSREIKFLVFLAKIKGVFSRKSLLTNS